MFFPLALVYGFLDLCSSNIVFNASMFDSLNFLNLNISVELFNLSILFYLFRLWFPSLNWMCVFFFN